MLVKAPRVIYHPGVPAKPEIPAVPYRAAYTECYQPPAPGEYRAHTTTTRYHIDDLVGKGISYDPSTTTISYDGDYVYLTTTVYRWVTTGPAPPEVCVTHPERPYVPPVPAVPAVPPRVEYNLDLGWTAGANSVDVLTGDVSLRWKNQRRSIGVVLGITNDREANPTHDRMSHAVYFFQTTGGTPQFAIMEHGAVRTAPRLYDEADTWEIRRVGQRVIYLRNDEVINISARPSSGEISTGAALYAAGDQIGSGAVEPPEDPRLLAIIPQYGSLPNDIIWRDGEPLVQFPVGGYPVFAEVDPLEGGVNYAVIDDYCGVVPPNVTMDSTSFRSTAPIPHGCGTYYYSVHGSVDRALNAGLPPPFHPLYDGHATVGPCALDLGGYVDFSGSGNIGTVYFGYTRHTEYGTNNSILCQISDAAVTGGPFTFENAYMDNEALNIQQAVRVGAAPFQPFIAYNGSGVASSFIEFDLTPVFRMSPYQQVAAKLINVIAYPLSEFDEGEMLEPSSGGEPFVDVYIQEAADTWDHGETYSGLGIYYVQLPEADPYPDTYQKVLVGDLVSMDAPEVVIGRVAVVGPGGG